MVKEQQVFEREATKETPYMHFDAKAGEMLFEGASLPENPLGVYTPVLEWFIGYVQNPAPTTRVTFNFSYYNTSTSKVILGVLEQLEALQRAGHTVEIVWHYPYEDEDMEEAGREYAASTLLPFVMKENPLED